MQHGPWLKNTFGQLDWITDDTKYSGYVVSGPIYDVTKSMAIASFFSQHGITNAVSMKSISGHYHRVFLPKTEVEAFIVADQFRDGRNLSWSTMFEFYLEEIDKANNQQSLDSVSSSSVAKLRQS